ncbi:MAG TPA: DUF2066 domain-containing protein [Rhizomicrobium sp.]|nr:DUF2066 domain-containing protein [Rhizomicrobium sp.]
MRSPLLVFAIVAAVCGSGAASRPKVAAPVKTISAKPAKGDPYSVTVPVDATAASASVAENNAINGGRGRAWAELSHRLVPQKDWSKLPALDNTALERLIRGYSVANEKRSTTRYVARITYVFNPAAVKHLFRVANLGVAEQTASAILLIAMSPTYNAHAPWAQAVAQPKYASAQFPLVTPVGDAVDQSSLGPLRFADAGWGQVQSAAARVHAGEAVLMQAGNPAAGKLTVRMRRIGPGKLVGLSDVEVAVAAGTSPEKAYAAAAEQAEGAIEDAWKNRGTVDLSRKTRMVAEAHISSLEQWNNLYSRLSSVSSVSDLNLIAMNTGEARVGFSYTGTPDQLRAAAEQSNLTLTDRGGSWWIAAGKASADEAASPE